MIHSFMVMLMVVCVLLSIRRKIDQLNVAFFGTRPLGAALVISSTTLLISTAGVVACGTMAPQQWQRCRWTRHFTFGQVLLELGELVGKVATTACALHVLLQPSFCL